MNPFSQFQCHGFSFVTQLSTQDYPGNLVDYLLFQVFELQTWRYRLVSWSIKHEWTFWSDGLLSLIMTNYLHRRPFVEVIMVKYYCFWMNSCHFRLTILLSNLVHGLNSFVSLSGPPIWFHFYYQAWHVILTQAIWTLFH